MAKQTTDEETTDTLRGALDDRNHRLGQLCETLSVMAFAGAALVSVLLFRTVWMVVALLFAVCAFALLRLAIAYADAADKERQKAARKTRYVISAVRIETLREVGAAKDALQVLQSLPEEKREFSEDELVGKLAEVLGSARTDEVKGVILKYTRVDPKKRSVSAVLEGKRAGKRASSTSNLRDLDWC